MPYLTDYAMKGTRYTLFYADGGTTKWSMPYFLCGKRDYDPIDNFPTKLTKHQVQNSIIHSNAVLCTEKHQDCFMNHYDIGVEMAPIQTGLKNKLRRTEIWRQTRGLRKLFTETIDLPYRRAENILKSTHQKMGQNGEGFYWVHLMDAHIPYSPPGLNSREKARANTLYEMLLKQIRTHKPLPVQVTHELEQLYDDECYYMDKQIHRFIEKNKDTLFIITSDHGEMFGRNMSYSHGPYYHGMTLELGHVPFIVYGRGVDPKVIVDYRASIDVGSTVLDFFDLIPSQGYGRSMKKEIMCNER